MSPLERAGYFQALIDINRWVRSQIGEGDYETLKALVDHTGRLSDGAKQQAAKGEAA